MTEKNEQIDRWSGQFGEKYTNRSSWPAEEYNLLFKDWFGCTRLECNEKFIGKLDRNSKILEVGCNLGNQLILLQKMGFKNLYGIELNEYTVSQALKRAKNINIKQGSIFEIPYKDQEFDMVFTSGVLIHIAPKNIEKAISEVNRCSKKYIWGYENYSEKYEMTNKNYLWRTNFFQLYLDIFPDFKLVKKEIFPWKQSKSMLSMFLLEK